MENDNKNKHKTIEVDKNLSVGPQNKCPLFLGHTPTGIVYFNSCRKSWSSWMASHILYSFQSLR